MGDAPRRKGNLKVDPEVLEQQYKDCCPDHRLGDLPALLSKYWGNDAAIHQQLQEWWEEPPPNKEAHGSDESTIPFNNNVPLDMDLAARISHYKDVCPPNRINDVEELVMNLQGDEDAITETIQDWWESPQHQQTDDNEEWQHVSRKSAMGDQRKKKKALNKKDMQQQQETQAAVEQNERKKSGAKMQTKAAVAEHKSPQLDDEPSNSAAEKKKRKPQPQQQVPSMLQDLNARVSHYKEVCPPNRIKDVEELVINLQGDEEAITQTIEGWWDDDIAVRVEAETVASRNVPISDEQKTSAAKNKNKKKRQQEHQREPKQRPQKQQQQVPTNTAQNQQKLRREPYNFFRGYTAEQRKRMTDEDMFDALYRPHEIDGLQNGDLPITHIGQMYDWHPELVTKEEDLIEEFYRKPWKDGVPLYWWKKKIDCGDRSIAWRGSVARWKSGLESWKNGMKETNGIDESASMEKFMQEKLAKRKPAMGLKESELDRLEREAANQSPLERKATFLFVRNTMLGQLISCDGARNMTDLVQILRKQLVSNAPAEIPRWFKCSDEPFFGTGYKVCENRGCCRTDTIKDELARCKKCKAAAYCSQACLLADHEARHKICCKEARNLKALYEKRQKNGVSKRG